MPGLRLRPALVLALAGALALSSACDKDGAPAPLAPPSPPAPPTPPPAPPVVTPGCAAPARQFDALRARCHLPAHQDRTTSVAVGDVDGDGDADLVVGNGAPTPSRVYLNDGAGRFGEAAAALPPGVHETTALALGDVDGDGDLDLVCADLAGPNRLLENDGAATFTDVSAARLPADGDATAALALLDADGDGDLDLVLGNLGAQNRLYLNDGDGTFTDATGTRLPSDADTTTAIAAGDLDGDGDVDMVVGNIGQNRLYLNDGRGVFADVTGARLPAALDSTYDLALADVDGDGDSDVVAANLVRAAIGLLPGANAVLLNDGAGAFTASARVPAQSDSSYAVAAGDVDGDGDLDLVFGNGTGLGPGELQNELWRNDGSGGFVAATAATLPLLDDETRCVALADLDGDGGLDLFVGNDAEPDRLLANDGGGRFTDATAARIPARHARVPAVALGDVDGDASLDAVLAGAEPRLWRNDGTGTLADATEGRLPGGSSSALALGDVDADGDRDIVFGRASGAAVLLVNDGHGAFAEAPARMPQHVLDARAVVLGDVDGDGMPDLVFACGDGAGAPRQNRLYVNDGAGGFRDETARLPFDADVTNAVALGDVDGDGDLDVVFGNGSDGTPRPDRLYLNDGAGTFADAGPTRLPAPAEETLSVALGDVDGDGDLDLVAGTTELQPNRLYLNDGGGAFAAAPAGAMPALGKRTAALALADVDEDGDLDVLLGNVALLGSSGTSGQDELLLNDGRGTFTRATEARLPAETATTLGLALGDIDADGDADVFAAGKAGVRLLSNLHRHLGAPFLAARGRVWTLELLARPGYAIADRPATPLLGFARAATPLPLPGLGTLFLAPSAAIALPSLTIPATTGHAHVAIAIPADPSVAGVALFAQALIGGGARPGAARLTGYLHDSVRD